MNVARNALQASSPVIRALVGLVVVGLILVLTKWAAPVLTPSLLACFLAALVAPLHFWLERRGVSSTLALILLVVLMVVAMLFVAGLLWLSVQRLIERHQDGGGVIPHIHWKDKNCGQRANQVQYT